MKQSPLSPEEAQTLLGLTGAQKDRLETYLDLLVKWQRRINLVADSTLKDPWRRHILDSAQLIPLVPNGAREVVDLGSGAGFPGLVLAILGGFRVHLVESDARKAAFLAEAGRACEAGAVIHNERLENMEPFPVHAITARALAPLPKLLGLAEPFILCSPKAPCLFLKGRKGNEELTESLKRWMMSPTLMESISDPSGVVLKLKNVVRRDV